MQHRYTLLQEENFIIQQEEDESSLQLFISAMKREYLPVVEEVMQEIRESFYED